MRTVAGTRGGSGDSLINSISAARERKVNCPRISGIAGQFTALGSPAFACTPDLFPDLMAAALERKDLHEFANTNQLPVTVGGEDDVDD